MIKEKQEIDGFVLKARMVYDDDATPPWDREEGHGPVSDWTTRPKRPGERVLASDRNSRRYYDFAEAVRIAKRDGWDAPPYKTGTPGETAVRAVEEDFRRMHAWANDNWHYVGIILSVEKNGVVLDEHAASLWGIEDDSGDEYLNEVIDELTVDALRIGRHVLWTLTAPCN